MKRKTMVPFTRFGTAQIPGKIPVEIATACKELYEDQSRKPARVESTDLYGYGDLNLTMESYGGTFSYFENSNPTVSIVDERPLLPDQVHLNSVFPNPFNSSVTFSITGIKTGNISIDFYDLVGHHQFQHSALITSGDNSLVTVTMPATVSSGVYLYQVFDLSQHTIKPAAGKFIFLK